MRRVRDVGDRRGFACYIAAVSPRAANERIFAALEALLESPARERRLIVAVGPVYLLSVARRGEPTIEQEAVSSAVLPPELKLSSERGQLLRNLGFGKSSGRRNWKRRHGPENLAEIAEQSVDILTRVYGVDASPTIELIEDDAEHPENPTLVAAMRKVARARDEQLRHAMYSEMLNANFLVPMDPDDEDAEGPEALLAVEIQPSGRPTLAAFTDWTSLRLWNPRGCEYAPVHGSDLFAYAMARDAASVRINPEGDVGGELHRNEVEMLVRAVETFRRRHSN
jgi:hypothetical protein